MSRYSDKRIGAVCSGRKDCPRVGITLRVVGGKPNWYCADCAEEIDEALR